MSTINLLIFGIVVLWALSRGRTPAPASKPESSEKTTPAKRGPDLLVSLMVFFLLMLLLLESAAAA